MKITESLLSLSRVKKRAISIAVDSLGLITVAILALWLRLGAWDVSILPYLQAIFLLPFLAIPVFVTQGLYRAIIRYLGSRFAFTVFMAVSMAFVLWSAAIFMLDLAYPRSATIIAWLLAMLYISATRVGVRWFLADHLNPFIKVNRRRVVIFGAGDSGKQLLHAIGKMPDIKVIGFIDDDPTIQKHEIASTRVYSRRKLATLIRHRGVKEVLLAIPSLSPSKRRALLEWLQQFPVKVSTLPAWEEIISGKISVSDVREVNIEDLLGRDVVPPQRNLLSRCIENKNVLVTGAGGSIGSELCRKILKQNPRRLILVDVSEFSLYSIEQELSHNPKTKQVELIAVLGSVLNTEKMHRLCEKYEVDTVYHAAAYKHVPIVEHNIEEGIINNSFGTHAMAKVAAESGVKNFVLISTDKAVRPTNVMGASKRLAEMSLQALQNHYSQTCFVMVRFGNVLGSSGSVIPLFRKQIERGGPVTVTHPEITRYFMTIPEAVSLVVQAGSMGTGGDVFVLDMGEPVKIDVLAKKIIKLSGLEVVNDSGEGDIEIQYTGLRPGEKLFEELLIGDNVDGTDHPRIMKAHEEYIDSNELEKQFDHLKKALNTHDYDAVLKILEHTICGFNHTKKIVDYLKN